VQGGREVHDANRKEKIVNVSEEMDDEERLVDPRRLRPPTAKERREIKKLEAADADHESARAIVMSGVREREW
jgi:hypothetical protein